MRKLFFLLLIFLLPLKIIVGQSLNADSLKQKLASAKEDTARVNALSTLAYAYVFSYPDTAGNYAKQGLQLARKIGYKYGEGTCFEFLGLASNFSGDYTNALQCGLQSLSIFRDLQDTAMIVWSNIQVLTDYNSLEDYDQGLKYGYEATRLLKSPRSTFSKADSNQASVTCMLIGSIHEKRNQLDSALYYMRQGFAWDSSWYGAYQGIGKVYTSMGQYDSALHYYRNGVTHAVRESNIVFLVSLYNDISRAFELSGRNDSSIFYANKAIGQGGVQTITLEFLQASVQLAKLYELQGMQDSTIKYLKRANTLKDSLYSRKKTREAQNFAFTEVLRQQELIAQKQKQENSIRIAILLVVVLMCLLVGFFLWRNNRRKEKANALLESKNAQIEKALNDLRSTQAQLIQSEKMASLGELTAGIAHEIQNPLNFVNNFSEVNNELIGELVDEVDKGNLNEVKSIAKDIKENEEKIAHHGKRADSIVKGMLQHSRISTGQKEPADINALADEYFRLSYHGLRAKDKDFNAEMKTDFDESIGNINIIPQDIGRVLLNLYNNAFYAVKPSNPLKAEHYEPTVKVSTKKINDKIEIRVDDNGSGIPQKIVDKIFQPFFTTKPTGEGTGLGLSLSYDIIKAHGGEIKVESTEGEGTTFIIQLLVS